jgi:hypothetical protein
MKSTPSGKELASWPRGSESLSCKHQGGGMQETDNKAAVCSMMFGHDQSPLYCKCVPSTAAQHSMQPVLLYAIATATAAA